MKRSTLLLAAVFAALAGCATTAIDDSQLGLSKSSVFDTATPAPFAFEGPGAGQSVAPLAGSGMPPMISHPVDGYLPITAKANSCLGCHDRPQEIGKPLAKGQPAAAPASHYAKGADGKLLLSGASYNCIACHAPQAGVKPLVDNVSR
jgi:nitrate reductase (cytochrome), electron transfer subunit